MSKRKTPANSTGNAVTPDNLATMIAASVQQRINALMNESERISALPISERPKAQPDKTARQWANFLRANPPSRIAGDIVALNLGDEFATSIASNVASLPVYGAAKFADTLRACAAGDFSQTGTSTLHYGFMYALPRDGGFIMNDDIMTIIARVARDCPKGTAPTQRSSSAAAMRYLGAIIVENVSKTQRIAWDMGSPIAQRLLAMLAHEREIAKGRSL